MGEHFHLRPKIKAKKMVLNMGKRTLNCLNSCDCKGGGLSENFVYPEKRKNPPKCKVQMQPKMLSLGTKPKKVVSL